MAIRALPGGPLSLPEGATATVFRRAEDDSAFEPPVLLSAEAGDRLTSPLLPGLEIELAKLFAR